MRFAVPVVGAIAAAVYAFATLESRVETLALGTFTKLEANDLFVNQEELGKYLLADKAESRFVVKGELQGSRSLRVETGRLEFRSTSGDGERGLTREIVKFERPFKSPPDVHIGLTYLDVSHTRNLRIRVSVTEVDADNFVCNLVTWANTEVYRAAAHWIAIGE